MIHPISATSASPDAPLTAVERARAAQLTGSALRNAPPAEQRAAVASQFEAIFVRQMLGKTLTKMLGDEKGVAGSVYGDMLTDTFAKALTAGSGIGLAQMIEKQLAPRTPASTAAKSALSQTFPR
ncbi:MAG TPA: rod-binding protein [Opitutaceae bacterium]|nr:rod-binding protein [Opitutaceae bacterium]